MTTQAYLTQIFLKDFPSNILIEIQIYFFKINIK